MSSDNSTPDDVFSKLLQQHQDAVDDGNSVDAEASVHEIMAAAEAWCDQNPSPDFDLTMAASQCEENADWVGAESAYQQILSLPNLQPPAASKAHMDLAALYRLLHRDSDALRHARLATVAARHVDSSMFLAMVLRVEAHCLIRCDRIDAARAVVAEALSVIADDKMYDQIRGSILTLRAECAVRSGQASDAETDLEEAFGFLQPMAGMDMAGGIHRDLARLWSVTARLRTLRDDCDGAVNAWQEAVTVSKHVVSLPHVESVYTKIAVADMLKGLADTLSVCDRADDAAAAFAERTTILKAVGVSDTHVE